KMPSMPSGASPPDEHPASFHEDPSWASLKGTSATSRSLDRGDVDLLHAHHRIERALCFIAAGRQRLGQHARRDLPGDAPLVFAPAALALLPAIADDGIPVAVGLVLIVGGDLEREGLVMFEYRTAVETDARDAGNREFDDQHITGLAGWVVTGCTVYAAHYTVGKRLGVEAGSSLSVLIVPEANRILCHCESFRFEAKEQIDGLYRAGWLIFSYAAALKSPI